MISIIASWELWAVAGLVLAGISLFVVGLTCARALYGYGYGYNSGWQDAQAALARAAADVRERARDAPQSTGDLDAPCSHIRMH